MSARDVLSRNPASGRQIALGPLHLTVLLMPLWRRYGVVQTQDPS